MSPASEAGLEGELGLAAARAFVQLSAVGYIIKLVFEQDRLVLVVVLLAMTLRSPPPRRGGARRVLATAGRARADRGRDSRLVVALAAFAAEPRYLVPVGGMMIGNAMTAAPVALNRLGDDVRADAPRIRGHAGARRPGPRGRATGGAAQPALRLIPLIDSTKTTGLASSAAPWSACCWPAPTPSMPSACSWSCCKCCWAARAGRRRPRPAPLHHLARQLRGLAPAPRTARIGRSPGRRRRDGRAGCLTGSAVAPITTAGSAPRVRGFGSTSIDARCHSTRVLRDGGSSIASGAIERSRRQRGGSGSA